MPLRDYGVLRGSIIAHRLASGANPHFQLHVVDDADHYRIAVNVSSALKPSELAYCIDANFQHPVLQDLADLPMGWSPLQSKPGGAALDFIRSNLVDPGDFHVLGFAVPGPDNDLNERLEHYVLRAVGDEAATVYAFGQRWGPEPVADKIFGFKPGNGVHDIHMNQANVGRFVGDDGVYQDGALVLHFPSPEQWVAIFLKFQSQTWHTDDRTGHQIGGAVTPDAPHDTPDGSHDAPPSDPGAPVTRPDGRVRIVAALANAVTSPEAEFVTLINTTAGDIDLSGWKLLDRDKHAMSLSGSISSGEAIRVRVVPPSVLPNKGGAVTLLDASGLKVDGVAYTKAQAQAPGTTIVF